jgi:hypothetical protein
MALRTPNSHIFSLMLEVVDTKRRKNEIQNATVPMMIMNISRKKSVDFTDSSKLLMSKTTIVSSVIIPESWFLNED